MKLLHYSAEPLGEILSAEQSTALSFAQKPRGLWVSVEGEDDWASWCRDEGFRLQNLAVVTEISLAAGARIKRLGNAEQLDDFTAEYGVADPIVGQFGHIAIEWARLSSDYHGIIIAPYVFARRYDAHTMWYYPWDCASGCIWDASAIERAEQLQQAAE